MNCTQQGQLWLVTCDGKVLLRNEHSANFPTGKSWIELETLNTCFISIAANNHLVFALDHQGYVYFREGLDQLLSGTNWVKILMGLRSISLSRSNQVYFEAKYCFIK